MNRTDWTHGTDRGWAVVWMVVAAAEAFLILCFGIGQMISGF